MPNDRYTQAALTVIAASLVVLAVQNATPTATAQQQTPFCSVLQPCYVTNTGITPLNVVESRAQQQGPGEPLRNLPPKSGQLK